MQFEPRHIRLIAHALENLKDSLIASNINTGPTGHANDFTIEEIDELEKILAGTDT